MLLPIQLNLQNQAQVAWLQVSAPVRLVADVGAFTLTGLDAGLNYSGPLNLAQVSWLQASAPLRVIADTGVFVLAGQDANLLAGGAANQAQVSWLEVGTRRDLTLLADTGVFVLQGAPSLSDFAVTAEVGVFALVGRDATLQKGGGPAGVYQLAAAAGAFALVGRSALLRLRRPGSAVQASHTPRRVADLQAEESTRQRQPVASTGRRIPQL